MTKHAHTLPGLQCNTAMLHLNLCHFNHSLKNPETYRGTWIFSGGFRFPINHKHAFNFFLGFFKRNGFNLAICAGKNNSIRKAF